MPDGWDGKTYYGHRQLKPAPFNNPLVGSYVFLAGLSGAAQLLATLLDLAQGRAAQPTVRRGRILSLLAPTIGACCLIADLHTPKRFYNMLRVFKTTSPMSLGSWALVAFGAASAGTAALQFAADRLRPLQWLRSIARVTQLPASIAGAVLGTYTASLFSATSTPRWAAAPRSLAVRFGAASIASAAAAMSLAERRLRTARDLDSIAITALAVELAATLAGDASQKAKGLPAASSTADIAVPLGLFTLSLLLPRRSRLLSAAASFAVLGGSLMMRINVMREGEASAADPALSMRFAQPTVRPAGQSPGE